MNAYDKMRLARAKAEAADAEVKAADAELRVLSIEFDELDPDEQEQTLASLSPKTHERWIEFRGKLRRARR